MRRASVIVYDVSGPKTSAFLKFLPKSLRSKTLVVNSRFMGSIQDEKSFLSVLQISMKHPELGGRIAAWLRDRNRLREPSQAARR
jgi:hypothetical protein